MRGDSMLIRFGDKCDKMCRASSSFLHFSSGASRIYIRSKFSLNGNWDGINAYLWKILIDWFNVQHPQEE